MAKPIPANTVAGTAGDDTLDMSSETENLVVDGRAGNDTITGGTGLDKLYGGRGNDLIYASADDLLLDGGAGIDTLSFLYFSDGSGSGVSARLNGGMLGLNPSGGVFPRVDVIVNVENLTGSNQGDYLAGNRAVNRLDGGAGDDWLLASGSGDFLTGGTGADTFDLSTVSRTVTVTDFDYSAGDRLRVEGSANFTWATGTRPDADGVAQAAWIGTCDTLSGGTLEVVVLGSATAPTGDWFAT